MPNIPQLSYLVNPPTKTYNISVVGLRKSGKSCICNRFALPHPDLYRKDHLSVLSSTDFASEVINCNHWLYWGCVTRQVDDYVVRFRIIEQTEFVDDEKFPLSCCTGSASSDYIHRSTMLRLSSKHKMQYICKDQIGQESAYNAEPFPPGEIEINGFILVHDVSPPEYRSDCGNSKFFCNWNIVQEFLGCILKLRKPVVLALSKLDRRNSSGLEEWTNFQKTNEFKKIPMIETSAHRNVNIETVFMSLLKLMEVKPTNIKVKHLPYIAALKERDRELQKALDAFARLLLVSLPEFLTDWETFMSRYSHHADVVTYINLVGSSAARSEFETLIEDRRKTIRRLSLDRIPEALMQILPYLDPVEEMTFDQVISYVRNHESFPLFFQDEQTDNPSHPHIAENSSSYSNVSVTRLLRDDARISFHLALEPTDDSEICLLQQHLNRLMSIKRHHMEQAFLETSFHQRSKDLFLPKSDEYLKVKSILPGQPFTDLKPIIDSLEISLLSEDEMSKIYKQFQLGLHLRAREDFLDFLVERTSLFVKTVINYLNHLRDSSPGSISVSELSTNLNEVSSKLGTERRLQSNEFYCSPQTNMYFQNSNAQSSMYAFTNHTYRSGAPPRGVKETQLTWLDWHLSRDQRYQIMAFLPSERQTLITTYFDMLLPFPRWPVSKILSGHNTALDTKTSRKSFSLHGFGSSGGLDSTSDPCFHNEKTLQSHSEISPEFCSASSVCPSASWGGCADLLFKCLAYEYLPASSRCFEETSNFQNDDVCSPHLSTFLPDLEGFACPTLSVAVACVCTDTLAARAAVHLLSCMGFCTVSLISSRPVLEPYFCKLSTPEKSLLTSNCLDHHTPLNPLVLTASWPLPLAKISETNKPLNPKSYMNIPQSSEMRTIYNGQVRAELMSHHTLLNKLLACRKEFSHELSLFSASHSSVYGNLTSPCLSASTYNGIILIVAASSDDRKSRMDSSDISTRLNDQFMHNPLSSMKTKDISENDSEIPENNSTPRPLSERQFFTTSQRNTNVCVDCGATSFSAQSVHNSCICCELFGCSSSHNKPTNCACGSCCNCVHSVKSTHVSSSSSSNINITETTSKTEKKNLPSLNFPHRRRCWEARVAALSSIIDQIPKSTPHLILLAEPSESGLGKYFDCLGEYLPPVIYPASDQFRFSEVGGSVASDSCRLASDSTSSFSNRNLHSSDWMPVGTNVLDHVIHFLTECWSNVDDRKSTRSSVTIGISSSVGSFNYSNCSMQNNSPLQNSIPTLLTSTDIPSSPDKPFGGAFFSTFSAASATGRKAMQSANLALKKLSNSARRHHNTQRNTHALVHTFGKGTSSVCNSPEIVHMDSNLETVGESNLNYSSSIISCPRGFTTTKAHSPNFSSSIPGSSHPVHWALEISPHHESEQSKNESSLPIEQSFDSPNQVVDFSKSRLRSSISRVHLGKSQETFVNTQRSRCSVPDCTKLNITDDLSSSTKETESSMPENSWFLNALSLQTTENSCESGNFSERPTSNIVDTSYDECASDVEINLDSALNGRSCGNQRIDSCPVSSSPLSPEEYGSNAELSKTEETSNYVSTMHISQSVHTIEDKEIRGSQKLCTSTTQKTYFSQPSIATNSSVQLINSPSNELTQIYSAQQDCDSDGLESIYEDISIRSDQNVQCNFPVLPQSSATTINEEHIYMEPIDCFGPGFFSRHRIIPQKYSGFHSQERKSRMILNGDTTSVVYVPVYSNSISSLSQTSNNCTGNVLGHRRERHRSFSTPEGSSVITDGDVNSFDPTSFNSSFPTTFSKYSPYSFIPNRPYFRSVRSSHASSSRDGFHNPSTSNIEFNIKVPPSSLDTSFSYTPPTVCDVSVPYCTSISSPASATLSDDFVENTFSNDMSFNLGSIHPHTFSNPLPHSHHHHYWHHTNCPHYNFHHILPDNNSAIASTSKMTYCPQNTMSTVKMFGNSDESFPPKSLLCQSITRSNQVLVNSTCAKSNMYSLISTHSVCSVTASSMHKSLTKPILIDPTDFQAHYPGPCSFISGPDFRSHYNGVTWSCSTNCTHTTTQTKDSKWLRRGKRLKFFNHHRQSSECHHISSSSHLFPISLPIQSNTSNKSVNSPNFKPVSKSDLRVDRPTSVLQPDFPQSHSIPTHFQTLSLPPNCSVMSHLPTTVPAVSRYQGPLVVSTNVLKTLPACTSASKPLLEFEEHMDRVTCTVTTNSSCASVPNASYKLS